MNLAPALDQELRCLYTVTLQKKEMSNPEEIDREWASSWMKKMEGLSQKRGQPQPGTKSIFRVMERIRATDPNAYEPKVVSIGPYHQNKQPLKSMDEVKLLYLSRLLGRNPMVKLEDYLRRVHGLKDQSRGFYSEEINMGDREFSDMLLLDGCFIIELLLAKHDVKENTKKNIAHDPILGSMLTLSLVEFDMLLLENQIPLVVLECIHGLVVGNSPSLVPTVVAFFSGLVKGLVPLNSMPSANANIFHLLHLFHSCFIVPPMDQLLLTNGGSPTFGTSSQGIMKATESMLMTPCATDLMNVGVRFKRKKIGQSFSWDMPTEQSVIRIFPARLSSNSNSFYRNLIAFEQHFFPDVWSKVMTYVMFMSCLIDSEDDLTLLRRERIVVYTLNYREATNFFRKLCKDTVMDYDKSYLSRLQDKSMQVWKIYDTKWNRTVTELKSTFFSNPLSMIYLIASAIFVVVLTILQTVYTVLTYYNRN